MQSAERRADQARSGAELMHYYQHHIGDFNSGTKNFSRLERWLYRDMLEMYYDGEKPLIGDFDELCDELGAESNEEKSAVSRILRRKFVLVDDKYRHDRCEEEISKYQRSVEKARENGKKGGRPAKTQTEPKANETESVILANQTLTKPLTNHKPITNNQEPATTTSPPSGEDLLGQDSTSMIAPDDVRICPVGQLVNLYHELMPLNPRIKVLNEARKKAIRQRWKEAQGLSCKPFGYSTKAQGMEAWRQFFEVCAMSDFLTGRSPSIAGRPAFIADIDFIFSPAGFAKILENKYHRVAA